MMPPYEPTVLLAVMAVLVAEHGIGIGLRLGVLADVLVAGVGAATYADGVHLSAVVAACWLSAAAIAGDQLARLGGQLPQHDPLGLLDRTRTAGTFAVASILTDVLWIASLVALGRVAASIVL